MSTAIQKFNTQANVLSPGGTTKWTPTISGWQCVDAYIENDSSYYLTMQTQGGTSGVYASGPNQQTSFSNFGNAGQKRYIAGPHQTCVVDMSPTSTVTFELTATPPTSDIPAPSVAEGDCRIEISDRGLTPNPGVVNAQIAVIGSVSISAPVSVNGTVNVQGVAGGTAIGIAGSVSISGTPSVTISGTPTVAIAANQSIAISGTPTIAIAANQNVNIANTPAVTVSSGTIDIGTGTVSVSGTPSINIASQGITVETNQPGVLLANFQKTNGIAWTQDVSVPNWVQQIAVVTKGGSFSNFKIQGDQTSAIYASVSGGLVAGDIYRFAFIPTIDTSVTVSGDAPSTQVEIWIVGIPQTTEASLGSTGDGIDSVLAYIQDSTNGPLTIGSAKSYESATTDGATIPMSGPYFYTGSGWESSRSLTDIITNTDGEKALAADRPPDDWYVTANAAAGTATATQNAPGAGKRLVVTGLYYTAAGYTNDVITYSFQAAVIGYATNYYRPPLLMPNLRIKLAQNTAATISATCTTGENVAVLMTGYTVNA
ncbi:MAG: hypothetical protein KGL39_12045 [Patescibacteria group bacterium]|nr:hypothetical protein [Patescibacteria group bacterium]